MKKKTYFKQLYHPNHDRLAANTEENILKEHILVSCELAGLTPKTTFKIINRYLHKLKDYKNIKPVVLCDMMPKIIQEIEDGFKSAL